MSTHRPYVPVRLGAEGTAYVDMVAARDELSRASAARKLLRLGIEADRDAPPPHLPVPAEETT